MEEEINNEIFNENYISAVEKLLNKYNECQDPDYLEIISHILSKPLIVKKFKRESLININKTLNEKGFAEVNTDFIHETRSWAEFPAIGENDSLSSIKAIEVSKAKEEDSDVKNINIEDKIINKIELFNVVNFTLSKVQESLCDVDGFTKDTTILNWGLSFNIREHLLSNTKYEPVNNIYLIDGTSFHFAAVVACIAKLFNLSVNDNYIFTGAFDDDGNSIGVKSLKEKYELILRERPNTEKIFIPSQDKFDKNEKDLINSSKLFVEVDNIYDLIEKVFGKSLQTITQVDLNFRKKFGHARIWAEYFGSMELDFSKENSININITKNCIVLHFIRPPKDNTAFKIFPIKEVYHTFNGETPNFIIFNGALANHYTGYLMTSLQYKQSNSVFGVRLGWDKNDVFVFAAPREGQVLLGYQCKFNFI